MQKALTEFLVDYSIAMNSIHSENFDAYSAYGEVIDNSVLKHIFK